MKLGSVLSGTTSAAPAPEEEGEEEEDVTNIPWYDLTEDQLLSDNDWWTRQQTVYQQMKTDEPEFFDVLRRSATVLSNRQLLTPEVKASLSALYGDAASDVSEAVSYLRAFGRARKLTGSDSPIFTSLEGLKTPRKSSAQVISTLERLLVSVPRGEDAPMGTTTGALVASQRARKNFPVPAQGLDPVDSSLHFCLVSRTFGRGAVGKALCRLTHAARASIPMREHFADSRQPLGFKSRRTAMKISGHLSQHPLKPRLPTRW